MAQQQGLSEGSLRNSHREIHPVKRKRAPTSLHELANRFVEECLPNQIIRRRYDPERLAPVLQKQEFVVLENESKSDPGFIVCLPAQPAVYIQYRRTRGKGPSQGDRNSTAAILRLRIHDKVRENGGSIFVATLDDVGHGLRIEDCWVWCGEVLIESQPFSKRREVLDEFVTKYWIPDARLLGGVVASVANPISIEEFLSHPSDAYSVEFIPEKEGRTRIWFQILEDSRTAPQKPPPHAKRPQTQAEVRLQLPSTVRPVQQDSRQPRMVRAVALESLPDVFEIYGKDGLPIGRASVQNSELSQKLRGKTDVWVMAEWNSNFGGYTITKSGE
jgi:hypothetical protein